jgi:hypothetical protein
VNQHRDSQRFEQRLLDELKTVVAKRDAEQAESLRTATHTPGWRRAPRLALAGAAVLVAAVAMLVFNSGGDNPPQAFAVEPQEGGGVRIEVYSLEDAAGLERALEDAGIPAQVTWLPPGTFCREPHFTPSIVKLPGGGSLSGFTMSGPGEALTISVGSTESWRKRRAENANVNLDPAAFRSDQSVVLSGSARPFNGDPEGGYEAKLGVAEGPVQPCVPVAAPAAGVGSIEVPAGAKGGPAIPPPAAGQYLYEKTKVVQLQGWEPDGPGAGPKDSPRYFTANLLGPEDEALPALVPTLKEVWTAPDGKTREREVLGRVEFLSPPDQERWEAQGSPPPFAYDPAEHEVRREDGRALKEFASRNWRGRSVFAYVDKLAKLPTEPQALRLAIENRRGGSAPVAASPADSTIGGMTAERLIEILGEPITNSALRAAAIDALAEIPGIELEHDVTDAAGRRGDAIVWERERGFGQRIVFDPRTSQVLARAEMIFDADAAEYPGVPDDTVFREIAYLRSWIVDSVDERPAKGGESR